MLIGKRWKIEATDHMNVTLYKKMTRTNKETDEKYETWNIFGYYSTPKEALHVLVSQAIRDTELTDLKTVVDMIEVIHKEIEALPSTYHQHPLDKLKEV